MITTTVLATCYAINPYKGSEDAMGWNFVMQIARYRNVIAITRENNRQQIEQYMRENPHRDYDRIEFHYFDLPRWQRFWKKGGRGALLYYYLWQRAIVGYVKRKKIEFDVAHNVNFHNDWTPTFLWKLDKPMVWGPVGHHPKIPKELLEPYSKKVYFKDRATWLVKKAFWNFSPALKKSVEKADHIWCMNRGVPKVLPVKPDRFSIFPSVASEDFPIKKEEGNYSFQVLSVGRFVPLKGFDLTIRAFANFIKKVEKEDQAHCRLTLVGSGPEITFLKSIIEENRLENFIEIIEWMKREDLMKIYAKSAVFLFPSHEGAGMVVPEAMSFGLPIVCLDNEGPGEFINSKCGISVPNSSYNQTVDALGNALLELFLFKDHRKKMGENSRKMYEKRFSWAKRGDFLNEIYTKIGA